MQWHLARCRRKLLSDRYEISSSKNGYCARYNPTLHPQANLGLHSGGRTQLGVYRDIEDAKQVCEAHALRLPT